MAVFVNGKELIEAKEIVYRSMQPTMQRVWPGLTKKLGCEVWVKHENHTPLGAFKIRGGLVYMEHRILSGNTAGVITASTGNHGQSIPYAAGLLGVKSAVVVPTNNSTEKNAAIRSLDAELIEVGDDFDSSKIEAKKIAKERNFHMVPSFHKYLVQGVSTYAAELFENAGELDAVYVPIGLGSGICGVMAVRDLLGFKTKIIGVVSENANAYKRSFNAGKRVETSSAGTFAEGIAVRSPDLIALEAILAGVDHIVEVSDQLIADAIRLLFSNTHNVAEGAGAASLAGLLSEQSKMINKRVGIVLCGGNIDSHKFSLILNGGTPSITKELTKHL